MIKPKKRAPRSAPVNGRVDDGTASRAAADIIALPGGDTLFQQGDPVDFAYVVVAGSVELLHTERSHTHALDVRYPGDLLGEECLYGVSTRIGTARARRKCEVRRIPARDLPDLIQQQPVLYNSVQEAYVRLHPILAEFGIALRSPLQGWKRSVLMRIRQGIPRYWPGIGVSAAVFVLVATLVAVLSL